MKKYYFNDGTSQQGPFTPEELKEKNITAETPVWYDGLPDWTTAGQLEELKGILAHTPPPFHAAAVSPVEAVKPSTPVVTTTAQAAASTAMAAAAPAQSSKKSTAWLSYVLALLVVGAVGYLVYQDMEKNKGNSAGTTNTAMVTDSTANTTTQQTTEEPSTTSASVNNDTVGNAVTTEAEATTTTTPTTTETVSTTPVTTEPATVTTTKTTAVPATKPDAATINAQKAEAQKLAQKKAEEAKKKLLAAAALKEKEYRNNWPKYIRIGQLDYNTKGDGVDAFNVPVFNGTNMTVDNVIVRVDYMKKEKKLVKSETLVISNIAPGTTAYGRAPEYKKGNNIKVIITNISSRKLHFCYPANNGNPADPYFCK